MENQIALLPIHLCIAPTGPLFGLFCIKSNQPANESLKGITLKFDVGHTNRTIRAIGPSMGFTTRETTPVVRLLPSDV